MLDILNMNNNEIASARLLADAFSLLTESVITQESKVALSKLLKSRKKFVEYLDNRVGIAINSAVIVTVNSYIEILEKTFELIMNRYRDKILVSYCKKYEEFVDDLRSLVMSYVDNMMDHVHYYLTKIGCKNNVPAATVGEITRVHRIRKDFFGIKEDVNSELTTRLLKHRLCNKPLSDFKDEDILATLPLIKYAHSKEEIDKKDCDIIVTLPNEDNSTIVYTNYFVEERNGVNLLRIALEGMRDIIMHYPDENPVVSKLVKIKYDTYLDLSINEYIEKIKEGKIKLAKDFQTIVDNFEDIVNLIKRRVIKVERYRSVRTFLAGVYNNDRGMWSVLNPYNRSDVYGDKTLITMWEARLKVLEDNEEYMDSLA